VSEPIRATVAVDALLDELAIIHLDFHPTCEVRVGVGLILLGVPIRLPIISRPCEAEAVGVLTCRMCGTAMTCCDDHRREVVDAPYGRCAPCDSAGAGVALFRFTPWAA
jgi:hypothetical protein